MKIQKLIIIFAVFSTIYCAIEGFTQGKTCEDYEGYENKDYDKDAYSLDFCRSLLYEETKFKCCYLYAKDSNGQIYHRCKRVGWEQFYDIDATINNIEKDFYNIYERELDVKKLICDSSSYLYISLALILLILL